MLPGLVRLLLEISSRHGAEPRRTLLDHVQAVPHRHSKGRTEAWIRDTNADIERARQQRVGSRQHPLSVADFAAAAAIRRTCERALLGGDGPLFENLLHV